MTIPRLSWVAWIMPLPLGKPQLYGDSRSRSSGDLDLEPAQVHPGREDPETRRLEALFHGFAAAGAPRPGRSPDRDHSPPAPDPLAQERFPHPPRQSRDRGERLAHPLVGVDLPLEHVPVVDPRETRQPR